MDTVLFASRPPPPLPWWWWYIRSGAIALIAWPGRIL